MEKRPPLPGQLPSDPAALADTVALPSSPSMDDTADEGGALSRRIGGRGGAYASVTGESGQHEVVADAPVLERPKDAPRYEVGPLLGQGGMGEVILHKDHLIGRHVAKKTLLPQAASERALARFVREARVQGQLEHPSVVPVYDFGVGADGKPFFTMKRVRGETLARIVEGVADKDQDYAARFSRHKLLAAFRQVCLAVEYAHTRGVVHRDLKPSNIMLGDFGEVYVLDWGLAKLRTDDATEGDAPLRDVSDGPAFSDRTGPNDMVGTPAYMAPEQFGRGRNAFDTRQDVFALGAILFEILTLTRYRPGASFATLLPNLVRESDRDMPTPPSSVAPDISPELDLACTRALAASPGARFESAGQLADIVERYLEGDRDQVARKAMAAKLLDKARALVAGGNEDGLVHVEAMKSAIKALALTPDDVETQRLLLSLVVDGSGKLPKEAEAEFEGSELDVDAHGLRLGILGLGSWFFTVILAVFLGVRDWSVILAMCGLNGIVIGYASLLLRWRTRATKHMLTFAGLLALLLAMSSCWLGPFVLVPVATCGISLLFGIRCTREQRPWVVLVWALGALAPFAIELLHVFPPAYTFQGGEIILHPRALELPEGLTLAALAYTAVSFMVLPMLFIGKLRDKQHEGDRKLFVQAWHLRQLFPAADARSAKP